MPHKRRSAGTEAAFLLRLTELAGPVEMSGLCCCESQSASVYSRSGVSGTHPSKVAAAAPPFLPHDLTGIRPRGPVAVDLHECTLLSWQIPPSGTLPGGLSSTPHAPTRTGHPPTPYRRCLLGQQGFLNQSKHTPPTDDAERGKTRKSCRSCSPKCAASEAHRITIHIARDLNSP